MKLFNRFSFLCVSLLLAATGLKTFDSLDLILTPRAAQAQDLESKKIPVPTPQEVVDKMIDLAGVRKGDVVYDLGSGDGRIRDYGGQEGRQGRRI